MTVFLTEAPLVAPIAHMSLDYRGVQQMMDWVKAVRPACLPSKGGSTEQPTPNDLFPHKGYRDYPACENRNRLTGNELLVELCGRKCYNSFGDMAGRKTNAEYIEHTQGGEIPHASILYQAKMSFFIAGISRRVSHELIRHYVGADREEEGNPSQESTRYVEHSGRYIVHPRLLLTSGNQSEQAHRKDMQARFADAMRENRSEYLAYIASEIDNFKQNHGVEPKGMDRKRIYEAASAFLSHSAETSFIWTTNPIALAKLIRERQHKAADLEFRRLARTWKAVALENWPNLFPQPWMKS